MFTDELRYDLIEHLGLKIDAAFISMQSFTCVKQCGSFENTAHQEICANENFCGIQSSLYINIYIFDLKTY